MSCPDATPLTFQTIADLIYFACSFMPFSFRRGGGQTVSFWKFIIKAWRSMIMAFVLMFVIFAKATVVEFPQIYLYTRAVSGV